MRYIAGFAGGLVVAVLLLVFQQQLIGSDREHGPLPSGPIVLPSVPMSQPAAEKIREPRETPPEPEPLIKPVTSVTTHTPPKVVKVEYKVPRIPGIDVNNGDGIGVRMPTQGAVDGGATVRVPIEPQYPLSALRNRIEGEVEVEFTVLADGSVADVDVIRANPRGVFEQSAVRAVLRWQFVPKHENGVPVTTRARQVIRFELPAGS